MSTNKILFVRGLRNTQSEISSRLLADCEEPLMMFKCLSLPDKIEIESRIALPGRIPGVPLELKREMQILLTNTVNLGRLLRFSLKSVQSV